MPTEDETIREAVRAAQNAGQLGAATVDAEGNWTINPRALTDRRQAWDQTLNETAQAEAQGNTLFTPGRIPSGAANIMDQPNQTNFASTSKSAVEQMQAMAARLLTPEQLQVPPILGPERVPEHEIVFAPTEHVMMTNTETATVTTTTTTTHTPSATLATNAGTHNNPPQTSTVASSLPPSSMYPSTSSMYPPLRCAGTSTSTSTMGITPTQANLMALSGTSSQFPSSKHFRSLRAR